MARKQVKVSRRMLFAWCMLGGLIFLFAPDNLTNRCQLAFARLFHWPLSFGRSISLSAKPSRSSGNDFTAIENQLNIHIANLQERLFATEEKLKQLSGLYDVYHWGNTRFVIADVTRGSTDELVINYGAMDGIAVGQFVLGDNSIIGKISAVARRTAKVSLITKPDCKIEVRISRLGIKKIMQGGGNNTAKIRMVSTEKKIKKGDKVFFRPKAGFLSVPIIVGTITDYKEDDDYPLLWDITVTGVCDIEQLDNVAVIVIGQD